MLVLFGFHVTGTAACEYCFFVSSVLWFGHFVGVPGCRPLLPVRKVLAGKGGVARWTRRRFPLRSGSSCTVDLVWTKRGAPTAPAVRAAEAFASYVFGCAQRGQCETFGLRPSVTWWLRVLVSLLFLFCFFYVMPKLGQPLF
jgi:hypothetical protein